MTPFYFGNQQRKLFGIYHTPHHISLKNCGVVICNPFGQEYLRSHRALKQLAVRLAGTGFPVLRFDYYGCGDSLGNSQDGTTEQWMDDISTAVLKLKKISGVGNVILIGLRLGAMLACATAIKHSEVQNLVLWAPITDGASYMAELDILHNNWQKSTWPKAKMKIQEEHNSEIIGFPLTESMKTHLSKLKLPILSESRVKNVLIISHNSQNREYRDLHDFMTAKGVHSVLVESDPIKFWIYEEGVSSPLVPQNSIQKIITWLTHQHK